MGTMTEGGWEGRCRRGKGWEGAGGDWEREGGEKGDVTFPYILPTFFLTYISTFYSTSPPVTQVRYSTSPQLPPRPAPRLRNAQRLK